MYKSYRVKYAFLWFMFLLFPLLICFVDNIYAHTAPVQTLHGQLIWQSTPGVAVLVAKDPQNYLIAVNYHGSSNVDILDSRVGKLIETLKVPFNAPAADLKDLGWNADGTQLGVLFYDELELWRFVDGHLIFAKSVHSIGFSPQLAWSPTDPNLLVVAWGLDEFRDERELIQIDPASGLFQTVVLMPGLTRLLWSPDGSKIAALIIPTENDPITEIPPPTTIQLLNPKTYKTANIISFDLLPTSQFVWRHDSLGLIGVEHAGSTEEAHLWQWDYNYPGSIRDYPIKVVDAGLADNPIGLNPVGNLLAFADAANPYVYILDVQTGLLLSTINGLIEPAIALTWLNDNSLVIASDRLRAFQLN